MSGEAASPADGLTGDAEALAALGPDDWARVLPVLRRALREVDDTQASPAVRRLRSTPTGQLVSGHRRAELCRLVAEDPALRLVLGHRLTDLPEDLRSVLVEGGATAVGAGASTAGGKDASARRAAAEATRRAERAQRRVREVREERDVLARRLDGALARAERAEREVASTGQRLEGLEREVQGLRDELDEARDEVERAVDRERRRGRAELAELQEQLRALRRREHERDERQRRREAGDDHRGTGPAPAPDAAAPPPRSIPARPTRLPETVSRGTAEEVDHLLSRGRLVLIDGYNVTRTHRDHLDLAGQRDWLVRRLATLAAQRKVRPVVVFDGERSSTSRPPAGARGVEVRFTPSGITADDELVLLVETLDDDEPVLAVTDDRELRERLRARRVDVVGTGPFLWATPG